MAEIYADVARRRGGGDTLSANVGEKVDVLFKTP